MILVDTNVLVYAYRKDSVAHEDYEAWVETLLNGDESFGMSDSVLAALIRIVTNPRIYVVPSELDEVLAFVSQIRDHSHCVSVTPGVRHWSLFTTLCQQLNARGNMVPDAWLAALAIEHGCEWITTDRDFARFPGLRWRHPFKPKRGA
jgi:toxin-antitoxin system PIN domain toxin